MFLARGASHSDLQVEFDIFYTEISNRNIISRDAWVTMGVLWSISKHFPISPFHRNFLLCEPFLPFPTLTYRYKPPPMLFCLLPIPQHHWHFPLRVPFLQFTCRYTPSGPRTALTVCCRPSSYVRIDSIVAEVLRPRLIWVRIDLWSLIFGRTVNTTLPSLKYTETKSASALWLPLQLDYGRILQGLEYGAHCSFLIDVECVY